MDVESLNTRIFKLINHLALTHTTLNQVEVFLAKFSPFGFVIVLAVLWFKKDEYKKPVLFCTYTATLGLLLNQLIAIFYFHPRPFMNHIGTLLIPHVPETSFPSDHATFMFSIAITLLLFKNTKILGYMLLILGALGAIARVYCGLHYPFDILGSFVVASFSCLTIVKIFRKNSETLTEKLLKTYQRILKKVVK